MYSSRSQPHASFCSLFFLALFLSLWWGRRVTSVPERATPGLAFPCHPPWWSVSGSAFTTIRAAWTALIFFLYLDRTGQLRTSLSPAPGFAVLAVAANAFHFSKRLHCWVPLLPIMEHVQLKLASAAGQNLLRCLFGTLVMELSGNIAFLGLHRDNIWTLLAARKCVFPICVLFRAAERGTCDPPTLDG